MLKPLGWPRFFADGRMRCVANAQLPLGVCRALAIVAFSKSGEANRVGKRGQLCLVLRRIAQLCNEKVGKNGRRVNERVNFQM